MKHHIFKTIETIVCEHFGTTPQTISQKNRLTPLRQTRQFIYYFCKTMFNECDNPAHEMSLSWIAGHYGQDHCTVLHAVKVVNNDAELYQRERERLIILTAKVKEALRIELRDTHPLPVEEFGS